MRLVRLGLLLCGAALFLWLLVSIGPGAIIQAFRDLSWRLLIILVFLSCIGGGWVIGWIHLRPAPRPVLGRRRPGASKRRHVCR